MIRLIILKHDIPQESFRVWSAGIRVETFESHKYQNLTRDEVNLPVYIIPSKLQKSCLDDTSALVRVIKNKSIPEACYFFTVDNFCPGAPWFRILTRNTSDANLRFCVQFLSFKDVIRHTTGRRAPQITMRENERMSPSFADMLS